MKPQVKALGRALNTRWRRFHRRLDPARGIILMYHRVAEPEGADPWGLSVSPEQFAQQLEVLQREYQPLSLAALAEAKRQRCIPKGAVAITFDDGYADNLYGAKPLLARYGIPATVFVITGHLGCEGRSAVPKSPRSFWWDRLADVLLRPGRLPERLTLRLAGETLSWDLRGAADPPEDPCSLLTSPTAAPPGSRAHLYYQLWQTLLPLPDTDRQQAVEEISAWAGVAPPEPAHRRPLTSEEIETLAEGELVEVGAHTVTHPLLSAQPLADQQREIEQSKADLEAILGRPVTSFSYPFGNRAPQTVALARAAGFACACSTVEESLWHHSEPFELPRFAVPACGAEEFTQRLRGWFCD